MTKNKILEKITTPRLVLRPLEISDVSSYFAAEQASLKEMAPYWSWAISKTIDDITAFIEFAMGCHVQVPPQHMYLAVLTKESHHFLGCVWCQAINWFVPKFEISYWLDSRKTGHGYMSEAINVFTRVIFSEYEAKRVEVKIFITNQKSRAIPERLGFKLDAILENNFIDFVTSEIIDGALYSCTDIKMLPDLNIEIL